MATSNAQQNSLKGKDLISTQFWQKEELLSVLNLAREMKHSRFVPTWQDIFSLRTFLMIFYNASLRTRLTFETAVTELGGHAIYFTPQMGWFKKNHHTIESIKDAASFMSSCVAGIGIRAAEDAISHYGAGNQLIEEYARYANVPVINMASDRFHPCQGLADIMAWSEWYNQSSNSFDYTQLKHKNFLLVWAKSNMVRTWSSVQESLLIASRFGMNITIARPEGYDLDSAIYQMVEENCCQNSSHFTVTDDNINCYDGAHVVYSRNWMSPDAYQDGKCNNENEIAKSQRFSTWTTTKERMARTDNAIYTHCMPIDRGNEVTDEVVDAEKSVVYQVAENRLHVQKAVIALTMGTT